MINHVPAFLELSGESLLGGDLVSFVCSLLKHQGAASGCFEVTKKRKGKCRNVVSFAARERGVKQNV